MRELSACTITRYERAEGVWGVSLHYRGENLERIAPQTRRIYEIGKEKQFFLSPPKRLEHSPGQQFECQIGEANKCIDKRSGENQ